MKPKCSIIIPNLNSPIIDKTIESILKQDTHYDYEIIVVGMDEFNLVKKHPQVNFIATEHPVSAGKARNLGIQRALGNILLFIDSDCVAMPDWINTLINDIKAGWKVIGGSVLSPTDNFWQLVYNLSMFHEQLTSKNKAEHSYLATLNLAIHRDVINKVGLLNEDLLRGQDIEWTSRMALAGYSLLFDPKAIIEHHPNRHSFDELWKDNYKSGYYMIAVRRQYPEIFYMPSVLNLLLTWRIFKPLIATFTTIKIILRSKEIQQYPKIFPYIFQLKVAWCDGAIRRLKDEKNEIKKKHP
jgi:glycosyltransferase involved in cell wall biosynthesis